MSITNKSDVVLEPAKETDFMFLTKDLGKVVSCLTNSWIAFSSSKLIIKKDFGNSEALTLSTRLPFSKIG